MQEYEDRILLRIKRNLTKDEEIGMLIKKLREVEFELGTSKAYISELEDQINVFRHSKKTPEYVKELYETKRRLHSATAREQRALIELLKIKQNMNGCDKQNNGL